METRNLVKITENHVYELVIWSVFKAYEVGITTLQNIRTHKKKDVSIWNSEDNEVSIEETTVNPLTNSPLNFNNGGFEYV